METNSGEMKSEDEYSRMEQENSYEEEEKIKQTKRCLLRSNVKEEYSTDSPGISLNSSSNTLQTQVKIHLKPIQYLVSPWYTQLSTSQLLYVTGEIIMDFGKRGMGLRWDSCWNQVKRCERVECDFANEIVILEFSQDVAPFVDFSKQAERFNKYPDLQMHQFGQSLINYEIIYKIFQQFTKNAVQKIKASEEKLNQFYQRKLIFDKVMRKKFLEMNEAGQCFLAAQNWPNLSSEIYVTQRLIYSKNLSNLLGVSQQSIQHILNRKGVVDFYDFDTNLALNRKITDAIVRHFIALGGNVSQEHFRGFEDIIVDDDRPLQFFTFDEIQFLAKMRIEYLTLDGLIETKLEDCLQDFYCTVIHIEPSEQTIKQLETLRKQSKHFHLLMLRDLESDFSYTIQSECFVSKLYRNEEEILNSQKQIHHPDKNGPKCGIKQINKSIHKNTSQLISTANTTDNSV